MNQNGPLSHSSIPKGSDRLLPISVNASQRLAKVGYILALGIPARVSVRQLLAFLIVANANAMGRSITLGEVRELAGDAMGQSIERTINNFFPPTKRDPEQLGWIEQVMDDDDRRRKYLVLTQEGRRVMNELSMAMEGVDN